MLSRHLPVQIFAKPIDQTIQASNQELTSRVAQARIRAMHEMLPGSMVFGLLTAFGVTMVLHERVPHQLLAVWLGARLLASLARFTHSSWFLRSNQTAQDQAASLHAYRALACMDGLCWGMLGWMLTPVLRLDIAIVTIGVLIGVAALGTFMLQIDLPSAGLFIVPLLLPNSIYPLLRQDDLGVFCAVSVFGLMVLLLAEARRSNLRIMELLHLRFQSEQVTQIQAEALRQAQALSETRSRFVATMSHEMRTPLHGMLGLVRLLRQREPDPQAGHQLDLIRGSGEHLVNVINDVLDFSRMEAGGLPLHHQAFDLRTLLLEVAETSNVNAIEKGLCLTVEVDMPHVGEVMGDPVRVRQVLHNLLGNAIKFTPQGFVRLHARHDVTSGQARIEVHDSGIGIAPHEQSRIFEAFHQAEGTYQRRFGGTGLGLTISRDLCRAMGGDLTCQSVSGQGAVFTFTLSLPACAAHPVAHSTSPASRSLATDAAPHVLLVDDNPVNALVAEAELHNMGIKVTVITNGRDAVDWLAHQRADLVLMDCEMPEMDGFEATRQIRERERLRGERPVSIVALTANGQDTCAERCQGAGMDDHLCKPFRPVDLARTLARYLRSTPQPAGSPVRTAGQAA